MRVREITRELSRPIILLIVIATGAILAWLMEVSGLVGAVDKLWDSSQFWFWPALLASRWLMAAVWVVGDWLLLRRLFRQGWLEMMPLPHLPLPVNPGWAARFSDTVAVVFSLATITFFASEIFVCLVTGRFVPYLP